MACAYASLLPYFDFPAAGPGIPKKGFPGLGFLRDVAKAAASWLPRFHAARRGTYFVDRPTDRGAPTRGARQIPETWEV